MLYYLRMHIIVAMNLKCFGCVSIMSFLDAYFGSHLGRGICLGMVKLGFRALGLIFEGILSDLWRQI